MTTTTSEVLRLPFQATSTNEQFGAFSGVAATWDNDVQGDRFQRGAFAATIADARRKAKARDGEVLFVVCWQHNKTDAGPIGAITSATETDRGLEVTGWIDLSNKQGQRAYSGLKKGYITDLSVAFIVRKSHYEGRVRVITGVELIEISVVTFGAQPGARVTGVKLDIKDIEVKMERMLAQLRFREQRSTRMNDDFDNKYGRPHLPTPGSQRDGMDDSDDERFALRRDRPQYFGGATAQEPPEDFESREAFERELRATRRADDPVLGLLEPGSKQYNREIELRRKQKEEKRRAQAEAQAAEQREQAERQAMMNRDTFTPKQFAEANLLDEGWCEGFFAYWIDSGRITPVNPDTNEVSLKDLQFMVRNSAQLLEPQLLRAARKRQEKK